MILYHRSKHKWDWPSYELIQTLSQGWGPELGLYTCNVDNLYKNYGTYLYEITLKKFIRPREITVTELKHVRDLATMREVFMEQGWQVLKVVEGNGESVIFVIMDMDCIDTIVRHEK